jgi:hypothetical protein
MKNIPLIPDLFSIILLVSEVKDADGHESPSCVHSMQLIRFLPMLRLMFTYRMWAITARTKGLLSDFVPSMPLSIMVTYEILMYHLFGVRSGFPPPPPSLTRRHGDLHGSTVRPSHRRLAGLYIPMLVPLKH